MKRLLTWVIDHGYKPDDLPKAHLAQNFARLKAAVDDGSLKFGNPEDDRVYRFLASYYATYGEVPVMPVVAEHFGEDGVNDVEAHERCKDLEALGLLPKGAKVLVGTNYAFVLSKKIEEFRSETMDRDIEIASLILRPDGHTVDGKKLRGLADARAYLAERLKVTAPKGDRAKVRTTADIFKALPPKEWLCEGLRIGAGGVCMFAGYGFSGKTMNAQRFALSVASGRPIGHHEVKRGRVLHLDFEQGQEITDERYQRLAAGMGISEKDIEGMIDVIHFPDVRLDDEAKAATWLAELITTGGYVLVIIDSFKAACPSTDENASKARMPLDMLARICDPLKVVPLVIHHARKPKKDDAGTGGGARMALRGSSALYDALTSLFIFSAEKNESILVEHEKNRQRGGRLIEDFGVQLVDVEGVEALRIEFLDKDAIAETKEQLKEEVEEAVYRKQAAKLLNFLESVGGFFEGNQKDLRAAAKMGSKGFGELVDRLAREKRMDRASGGFRFLEPLTKVELKLVTTGAAPYPNFDPIEDTYGLGEAV